MSLTPDEQRKLWNMEAQISSIFNVMEGDKLNKQPGIAERLNRVERNQDSMQNQLKRLTYIFIGIGIGVLIGAAIFGYLSWKQVSEIIKIAK